MTPTSNTYSIPLTIKFLKNLLGGLIVAEGILILLFPKEYVHLWRSNKLPKWWNKTISEIEKHEDGLRKIAGIETAFGLFLLLHGGSCCKKKQRCEKTPCCKKKPCPCG